MFRILTAVALLALTTSAALAAESLASRIHTAAVAACAPETEHILPVFHYGVITQRCIERISASATAKYQAEAQAKTMASTAAIANN